MLFGDNYHKHGYRRHCHRRHRRHRRRHHRHHRRHRYHRIYVVITIVSIVIIVVIVVIVVIVAVIIVIIVVIVIIVFIVVITIVRTSASSSSSSSSLPSVCCQSGKGQPHLSLYACMSSIITSTKIRYGSVTIGSFTLLVSIPLLIDQVEMTKSMTRSLSDFGTLWSFMNSLTLFSISWYLPVDEYICWKIVVTFPKMVA